MSARDEYIRRHAIDVRWFLALKAIRRPLMLSVLTPEPQSAAIEKAKILNDDSYNPQFRYPKLVPETIEEAKDALVNLRLQLCQEESNKSIVQLYNARLTELILEQELLLAVAAGDWEAFTRLNHELYGELNASYVASIAELVREQSAYFKTQLPNILDVSRNLHPTPEQFAMVQGLISGPDIEVIPHTEYGSEDIVLLWNQELAKTMPGWSAIIDPDVVHMLVIHRNQKVKIPSQITMKSKRMRKLFLHEIGTHVYRREQGKKNRFQLASIGLDGYQPIEEGLAILRQQLAGKKFHQFGGFDKYLTLAVATGALDGVPKDFNQTFRMMSAYYLDRLNRKRQNDVRNQEIAEVRAWNSVVRIFRGGNPSIPGRCLLRDKIYHEGNRQVWELLVSHPEHGATIMLGKYDPRNPLQLQMVTENA
jgi:hypothetical protein